MFDVAVGRLRLDIWKDGRGVVSRIGIPGECRRDQIPVDPEGFNPVPTLRAWCAGCLVASAICGAGAIQLLRSGSLLLGLGVCVVGLALAATGFVFLFGWRMPRHGGQFVTLDALEAEEFRAAAVAEDRALGAKPSRDARSRAEERLWELARQLSSAQGRR